MARVTDLPWYVLLAIVVVAINLCAAWEKLSLRQYRGLDENGICKRCRGIPEAADDPILGPCPNCDGQGNG